MNWPVNKHPNNRWTLNILNPVSDYKYFVRIDFFLFASYFLNNIFGDDVEIQIDALCRCDFTSSHSAVRLPSKIFVNEHVCFGAKSKSFYRRLLESFRKLFRLFEFSCVEDLEHEIVLPSYKLAWNSKWKKKKKHTVKCLIAWLLVRVCSNYFTEMSGVFVPVYDCALCISLFILENATLVKQNKFISQISSPMPFTKI